MIIFQASALKDRDATVLPLLVGEDDGVCQIFVFEDREAAHACALGDGDLLA